MNNISHKPTYEAKPLKPSKNRHKVSPQLGVTAEVVDRTTVELDFEVACFNYLHGVLNDLERNENLQHAMTAPLLYSRLVKHLEESGIERTFINIENVVAVFLSCSNISRRSGALNERYFTKLRAERTTEIKVRKPSFLEE